MQKVLKQRNQFKKKPDLNSKNNPALPLNNKIKLNSNSSQEWVVNQEWCNSSPNLRLSKMLGVNQLNVCAIMGTTVISLVRQPILTVIVLFVITVNKKSSTMRLWLIGYIIVTLVKVISVELVEIIEFKECNFNKVSVHLTLKAWWDTLSLWLHLQWHQVWLFHLNSNRDTVDLKLSGSLNHKLCNTSQWWVVINSRWWCRDNQWCSNNKWWANRCNLVCKCSQEWLSLRPLLSTNDDNKSCNEKIH